MRHGHCSYSTLGFDSTFYVAACFFTKTSFDQEDAFSRWLLTKRQNDKLTVWKTPLEGLQPRTGVAV